MDYLKVYERLIESRKKLTNRNEYLENHHILPKSMGGLDSDENRVKLNIREHLFAHLLLWKIYQNIQTAYGLSRVSNRTLNLSLLMGKDGIKIQKSIAHSEAKLSHAFGNRNRKSTEGQEIKKLQGDLVLSRKRPSLSKERRQQISDFFKNFKHTEKSKNKIGERNSIALRGRRMSEEEKETRNHSIKTKGQKRSDETRQKIKDSIKNRIPHEEKIKFINESNIDFSDTAWYKILSEKWNISKEGVRYWIKRYFPDKYYHSVLHINEEAHQLKN